MVKTAISVEWLGFWFSISISDTSDTINLGTWC